MNNDFKLRVKEILDQVGARLLGKEEGLARIKALRESLSVARDREGLLYFKEKWIESSGDSSSSNGSTDEIGSVLVIDAGAELAVELRKTAGVGPVIWARPAEAFERNGDANFSFRARQKEDVERLLGTLAESGRFPEQIVQAGPKSAVLSEQLALGPELALLVFQAALRLRRKEVIRQIHLHSGARDSASPAQACVAGLFKEIGLEHANFIGRVCRFDSPPTEAFAKALITHLWREPASSIEVELEGTGQRVRRRVAEQIPLPRNAAPVLRERGVCLITGGAGGLGLLFARHLAQRSRARLVLAGRSPLSEEGRARLRALEELGADVRYVRADTGRPGDLEGVVAEARKAFGPVNAVIHAAGIMPYGRTADIGLEALRSVWRSKIEGTVNLDAATCGEPLDWMALFSSISSVIGVAEACGYASGNAFLDSFADWRSGEVRAGRRSGRTVAFNWPLWREGGMRVDGQAAEAWRDWMWSSQGMRPLSTEKGLAAFEAGMFSGESRILVAEGDAERVARTLRRGLGWKPSAPKADRAAQPEKALAMTVGVAPREALIAVLKTMVGDLLSVPEDAINLKAGLGEFGFDSISLKSFAERLNDRFKLELMPSVFFSHSSLNALADHLLASYPVAANLVGGGKRPPEAEAAGSVSDNRSRTTEDDPIAIVGLSGVLPGSPDLETFWSHLMAGDDLITEIPASRWDAATAYQSGASGEGKTNSKWGGFIREVDGFDARFFGVSPWEADRMDPQHRLFLETAWNCLESAGEPASGLAGRRVGVFVGIQFHEYQDLLSFGGDLHAYNATGNGHAMIANRLSYFLDVRGPSEAVDTACSSSLVALNRAVSAIRGGECESAIVGGVSLILSPGTLVVTSQMGILSPDGRCKVFDAAANGYVKGEGVLAAYLMPLSKARSGGYPVWGLIRGCGVNHGGRASSLTAPNAQAQSELLVNIYRRAGVAPETVGYIEAHGTGTELGDPVEVEGLKSAFAALAGKSQWSAPFCGVGSVKSNIGHLEPAAGLAGAAKVLLALRHKTLPASLHLKTPNPYLRLQGGPFYLVAEPRAWEAPRDADGRIGLRRAGVSSFGFGGANAHVILEEFQPAPSEGGRESLPAGSVFVFSGKSEAAARRRLSDMAAWLAANGSEVSLPDLARTLEMGREHFDFRWAVVASDAGELQDILEGIGGGGSDRRARFGKAADSVRVLADPAAAGAADLAEAFARGDRIDWSEIYAGRPFRRVILPGYPFEKTSHWFRPRERPAEAPPSRLAVEDSPAPMKLKALSVRGNGAVHGNGAIGNGAPAPKAEAHPNTAPKSEPAVASRAEVARVVKSIVATALYLDETTLEVGKSFVDLGSDSILGVEIIRRINSVFRVNLAASKLYEHPNVAAISAYVAGLAVSTASPPVPAAEPARESAAGRPAEQWTARRAVPTSRECPAELMSSARPMSVVVVRSGDVEDLTFSSAGPGAPREGEIQVEVHATSVILPDLLCLRGLYPTMPPYPFTPGFEFAGVVRRAGANSSLHRAGDLVFGVTGDHLGAHAPLLNVREDLAVKVPPTLTLREAATIPEAFLTAYFALVELGRLEPGERVLIHSAASGTGLAAIQLAQWRQAEIFATVGSDEKAEYLRSLGVTRVVNYREGDLAAFRGETIGPRGVDVVLNMLTGEPREAALRCVAPFGRFLDLAVGGLRASGRTDLSSMVSNQVYFSIDCRRLYDRDTGRIQRILRRLAEMLTAGEIRPLRVNRVFDFSEAAGAYAQVRDRIGIGKTLLCRKEEAPLREDSAARAPAARETGSGGGTRATQDVAVIGLAGRFPGARDIGEFWELLSQGRCAVREVPPGRWAADRYFDPDPAKPGKTYSKWGGFLDGIDLFDPLFFNISPAEAEQMDPQQRLFLETAWHALEDAGYAGASVSGAKCGVFVGAGQGDYVEAVRMAGGDLSAQLLMGSSCSMIGARLAYFMNLTGPAVAVDTACSSSLVAIYQACQSLLAGDSDFALAGGVCVMTSPAMYVMMSKAGMLSPTGLCRTFDQKADGFAPGEGVGLIVLKRLDRALRDGDQIYGVIKGAASNQDGATNGITAPNPASQSALEIEVYRRSGVHPDSIGYVEAHGTGTKLGDPIELDALTTSFRAFTQRRQYCAIGSVKTNIGHTLSAAGVASAIKALLCLRHRKLVPTLHYERRNEHLELDSSPFYVNTELKDWPRPGDSPRRAAVSSFGFSGTNVHLVLEEGPATKVDPGTRKPAYFFALSARADDGLRERLDDLRRWLEQGPEEFSLESAAYSLNAGRTHFRKRCFLIADSTASLREGLARARFGEARRLDESELAEGERRARELTAELASSTSSPARYREILEELGGLYLGGASLEWERLHEGESRRHVSLPGYPFKRTRCWATGASAASPVTAIGQDPAHPLPGANASGLNGARFMREVRAADWSVRDHLVRGVKTMPGVAYLEMARAAGSLAGGGRAVTTVRQFVLPQPLQFAGDAVKLETLLTPSGAGAAFEIRSFRDGAQVRHAQGIIGFDDLRAAPEEVPIAELEAISRERLAKSQIYECFHAAGLQYGPTFQAVDWIGVSESGDAALARVELPPGLADGREEFYLHPALLDGALQTIAGWSMIRRENSPISLLFEIREVLLFGPMTACGYARARREPVAKTAGLARYNVQFFDEAGLERCRISGLAMRETARAGQGNGGKGAATDERPARTKSVRIFRPVWLNREAASSGVPTRGSWLVLDDDDARFAALANLRPEAVQVRSGSSFERLSRNVYRARPESQEDFARLISSVFGEARDVVRILHLWDLDAGERDAQGTGALLSNFALTRALLDSGFPALRLVQVCRAPQAGLIAGWAKTLAQEHTGYRCVAVEAGRNDESVEASTLLKELEGEMRDTEVRNTFAGRMVASYEQHPAPLVRAEAFRRNGVYLISGGLGGLGRLVAGHLTRTVSACVALLGRSKPTREQREWIESLKDQGGEAAYWSGDVTNLDDVKRVVREVEAQFGALHGVIHAAGLLRDARITKKGPEEMRAVLAPKVRGAVNLDLATQHLDLDFFALFSSAAGALGNFGQCDYAAANGFLDRFAEEREARRAAGAARCRTVSIGWPLWQAGGMRPSEAAVDWMRATWGLEEMESADGLRVLEEVLRSDSTRVLVLCGDERRWAEIARRKDSQSENRKAAVPAESDSARLRNQIIRLMAGQLKVGEAEIDQDEDFSSYGYDSISLTELSNRLNRACEVETTPALFFEYSTVSAMAGHLLRTYPDRLLRQAAAVAESVPRAPLPAGRSASELPPAAPGGRSGESRWIAVIAAQGRFPGAANVEEFWKNLEQGRDSVGEVPAGRWDWRTLPPELQHARFGGFIEGIDLFDAGLFGISRRESELMDPQQRLFLETVWTLLEEAGYPSNPVAPSRVGLFVGVSTCDYAELLDGTSVTEAHSPTGLSHSILVNRASHLLNLSGPSEAVNTACSSSLVALHRAVRSLREGECDLAVAAGVGAILTPTTTLGFLQAGMLSRDGRCKTFDAGADGYVRGEGVGAVLLKRWEDAVRDGDLVHGVILGSAVNHGGRTNTLTAPNPTAQCEVVLAACRDARVKVSSLSYIEAHGTGTVLGDPIEFNGLKKAFAADGKALPQGSCGLGAVKSNIGHLEAAAGLAGVIKVLEALRHRKLPATLHVREVNPYIRLDDSPFRIIRQTEVWSAPRDGSNHEQPLRAGVSSFGFGGANAHVVMGEASRAPETRETEPTPKPWSLATISARDQKALAAKIRELGAWLRREGAKHSLEDICHTLNAGRHHLFRRCAVLIRSREELLSGLEELEAGAEPPNAMTGERIRIKPEDEAVFRVVWESVSGFLPGLVSDPEAYREKLWALAGLYVKGYAMDWAVVHQGETRRRLPLPTYPFQRESYWVPKNAEGVAAPKEEPFPESAPVRPLRERLLAALAFEAAALLKVQAAEIRPGENLSEFGFDSVNFKALAAALSARFGLSLQPNLFFIHPTLGELADHLVESFPKEIAASFSVKIPKARPAPIPSSISSAPGSLTPAATPVAVVGMAGIFPGSPDLEAFWKNLAEGRDLVREVPGSRWDWRDSYGDSRRLPDKTNSKWGGFIDEVDCFDAGFFGISPREAEMMDPQQRLFLETAWRSIESGGLAPESLSGTSVGVFLGIQFNDYQELLARGGVSDAYSGTGNAHSIAANRISYLLNFTGPSETIDTACSSSLVAVHRAVQSLRTGECDAALAGGVNLMLSPSAFVATSQLGALSPDGRCRAFDAGANGYVRGEGAGSIFLMRLADAEKSGCPVLGIIKGSAVNHGGKAQSLTAPNAKAQTALLRKVFHEAGIDPATIGYVETHGTGTELGDPVEIEGLKAAFAPPAGGTVIPQSCGLGSVKSNIGHLEAAAGIAGLIKVLLALRHGTIPASLHFQKLNPYILLNGTPLYIVDRATAWERTAGSPGGNPRRAGVSSFGFGGTNAHVVLEEGPREGLDDDPGMERDFLFVLSGRTEEALRRRIGDLIEWLDREGANHALLSVSRTLSEGRGHYERRAAVVAGSLAELTRALGEWAQDVVSAERTRNGGSPDLVVSDGGAPLRVQETLDRLRQPPTLLNGSRRKYLEELAELYVRGQEVDWSLLYDKGRPPRRIALPAYPFARKRYWVPAPACGGKTSRGSSEIIEPATSDEDARCLRLLEDLEERKISLDTAVEELRRT